MEELPKTRVQVETLLIVLLACTCSLIFTVRVVLVLYMYYPFAAFFPAGLVCKTTFRTPLRSWATESLVFFQMDCVFAY